MYLQHIIPYFRGAARPGLEGRTDGRSPACNKEHRGTGDSHTERMVFGGMMGALKPLDTIMLCCSRGFRRALN